MGMSTYVIGFKPADGKWQKMRTIWNSCKEAGVEPPKEVLEFFDYEDPDPQGVEVKLPLREWKDDMREGYEIDIADIPKGVTVIRFYNSW